MGTSDESRRWLAELNELAAGYCADGHYAAAVPLFEQVVAGCAANLGADDPDTLISHGNLVVTWLRLEPGGPALHALAANVAARRRVLGARHPATVIAGQVQAAARHRVTEVLERELAGCEAEVGPDHPDSVALRTELAELLATPADQPGGSGQPSEPAAGGSDARVPAPRPPSGARFPRRLPDQRSADPDPDPGAGAPKPARRPRGARFPRGRG